MDDDELLAFVFIWVSEEFRMILSWVALYELLSTCKH
jgi:hypothetical protein